MTQARPLHVVCGLGEVGKALSEVLSSAYEVYGKDVEPKEPPQGEVDTLHICLNYFGLGHSRFLGLVDGALQLYKPRLLDVCSTVRPGTTSLFGPNAVHSTTRGLHPNLAAGLRAITKHVGGPRAEAVAKAYRKAGVRCVTHGKADTTELAHILNNSAYGVSLMFADEMQRLCREYGVDYYEAVMKYTETHNSGFRALDHGRLVRPILTPPYGRVGGHCVTQGATLIDEAKRGPLLAALARFNGPEPGWPEGEPKQSCEDDS